MNNTAVIGALFSIVLLLVGFVGLRLHAKLDELTMLLQTSMDKVHERISSVSERVTVIETKCDIEKIFHIHARQHNGEPVK